MGAGSPNGPEELDVVGTAWSESRVTERRAVGAHAGPLRTPTRTEAMAAALVLNRLEDADPGAIVQRTLDVCASLFPGRRFAVRLLARRSGRVRLVATTGRPVADDRVRRVRVSHDAARRDGLTEAEQARVRATVEDEPPLLFDERGGGFDVLLVTRGRLLGVVNVEYPPGVEEPEEDLAAVVPIAIQLSSLLEVASMTNPLPSPPAAATFLLREVVDEAIRACEPAVHAKGGRVDPTFGDEGTQLPLERRTALHEVLVGLLSEACRALPMRGGRIAVRTSRPTADVARIVVEDNRGPADKRRTLSGEDPMPRISLAEARAMMRRYGGDLLQRERVGEGRLFEVWIPPA